MKSDVVFALENAGWPALLVDEHGAVLRVNAAAVKLLGPAVEGAGATLAKFWAAENETPADKFFAQWESVPSPMVSIKFKLKDGGTAAHLTATSTFTHDKHKFFTLQLLSEAVQLVAGKSSESDTALQQKQKLDCALQLARTVALDFNNALTSILGHTSLLLSRTERDHPWRRSLLEVEKSAAKAAETANDLAAFSRQDKEVRSTQLAGNLNNILQRCVEVLEHSVKQPIKWTQQLERRLFSSKFDEAKMQQAFMKIFENSVEAIKEDGRITVQSRNVQLSEPTQDRNARLAPGSYICVEVSDSGSGIETEILPRIFEPFFTTKKAPHRGLGLAWLYGIVTNHGGAVAVSSQPTIGTSVRVYLPAEANLVNDHSNHGDDLNGKGTILMVDDEDLLLTMGETVLSAYGYKVFVANSGQRALEILNQHETPIDLVITDLVMPAMSGRELVERIRQTAPDTRIICTSGYVWPSGKQDDTLFLQKPFTSQELLMKIKFVLTPKTTAVD